MQEAPEDIAAGSHGVGSGGKDVPVDSLLTVEEVQAALDDPKISKTRKQKLKQRLKQLEACHVHLFLPQHWFTDVHDEQSHGCKSAHEHCL